MPIPTYDEANNFPSEEVLNEYAQPPIQNDSRHYGGYLKCASALVATSNAQNGRPLRFFSLPTDACIKEIRMFHKDASIATGDVGFYNRLSENEGAVIQNNAIANSMPMASARRGRVIVGAEEFPVDLTFGGGVSAMENVNLQLWQWVVHAVDGAYTEDPKERWDLCVKPDDPPGTAHITIICYYTDGS